MSLGAVRSTVLKSFPQEINIPWQGGKIPLADIRRLARISHGAKAANEEGEGLTLNLWSERPDEFLGQYARQQVQVLPIAGDIEALPRKHNIQLRQFNEIPLKTPIDKKLDHLRRTATTEGRNHAISAADIGKAQLADHRGGIVSDIRSVHPLEPLGKEPDSMVFNGTNFYMQLGKRKTEFMPIPAKYKSIPENDSDVLIDAESFTADFLIARPGTQATNDLKTRLAVRNSVELSRLAQNPQKYRMLLPAKVKSLLDDEDGLTRHPLSLSHRFDERQREKALKAGDKPETLPLIYQSRFDQERLPCLGIPHPDREFVSAKNQRGFSTVNRTGHFTRDMVFDLSCEEASAMSNAIDKAREQVLGYPTKSGSRGLWKKQLPAQRAQDDAGINYGRYSGGNIFSDKRVLE